MIDHIIIRLNGTGEIERLKDEQILSGPGFTIRSSVVDTFQSADPTLDIAPAFAFPDSCQGFLYRFREALLVLERAMR